MHDGVIGRHCGLGIEHCLRKLHLEELDMQQVRVEEETPPLPPCISLSWLHDTVLGLWFYWHQSDPKETYCVTIALAYIYLYV